LLFYLLKAAVEGCLEVILRFDGEAAGLFTIRGLVERLLFEEFLLAIKFGLLAFLWILSRTLFI
jgi:hypothetical protein